MTGLNPAEELKKLQKRMNRLMEDLGLTDLESRYLEEMQRMHQRMGDLMEEVEIKTESDSLTPLADIKETDEALLVTMPRTRPVDPQAALRDAGGPTPGFGGTPVPGRQAPGPVRWRRRCPPRAPLWPSTTASARASLICTCTWCPGEKRTGSRVFSGPGILTRARSTKRKCKRRSSRLLSALRRDFS